MAHPASESGRRTRGMLIALTGTTAWATTAIFISYLLEHYTLQPLTLAFWRDLMVGVFLLGALALWNRDALKLSRRDLPFFMLYGFLGLAVFNGMWTYSVKFNGAAAATVLAYSSPAFTVLLARPVLREPITARKWAAVALSLAGCVLVAKAYSAAQWQLNPLGIVFGLGTGLAFAGYNLAGRWSRGRFASAWTVTTYGFLFAALGLALTQRPETVFSMGPAWDGWAILAILTLPTVLGFGLYTLSLRYLQAGVASLIAALEPALTAIMAIFILKESLNTQQWIGAGLILLAVAVVQTEPASEDPAPPPAV